jgi:hypothetical protein
MRRPLLTAFCGVVGGSAAAECGADPPTERGSDQRADADQAGGRPAVRAAVHHDLRLDHRGRWSGRRFKDAVQHYAD